jgi:hypothetical protein
MGLGHSPSIVTSGLAFFVDAGNTKSYPGSGTALYDISGNGLVGTLTGGITFSSSNGGYFNFPGNHYIGFSSISGTVMSNPDITGAVSFGVWYYPTSSQSSQYLFTSGAGSGKKGIDILLQNSGNSDWVRVQGGTYGWVQSSISVETLNTWQNITVTWDNSSLKIYTNGILTNTTTTTYGGYATLATQLCLGAPDGLTQYSYVGRIANAFVYNTALTADQVLQNFNALRGRFGL